MLLLCPFAPSTSVGSGIGVASRGRTIGKARAAGRFGLRPRDQTFTLRLLARQLANATNRFGLLADSPFRRLLVCPSSLHLAENALALHLLLEDSHGLIDVVVADQDLQDVLLVCESSRPFR